ncbi:MAG: carboxypeptidase regulatory-like domain-containing protein [Planctomycetes bacterium]|nr:carboxypeptidase regulatory-like domain-containing protein [Planctomycetota bacterium]
MAPPHEETFGFGAAKRCSETELFCPRIHLLPSPNLARSASCPHSDRRASSSASPSPACLARSPRAQGPGFPPVPVLPENPLTQAKANLGNVLFWDEQLSAHGTLACATCHAMNAGEFDERTAQAFHPGPDASLGTAALRPSRWPSRSTRGRARNRGDVWARGTALRGAVTCAAALSPGGSAGGNPVRALTQREARPLRRTMSRQPLFAATAALLLALAALGVWLAFSSSGARGSSSGSLRTAPTARLEAEELRAKARANEAPSILRGDTADDAVAPPARGSSSSARARVVLDVVWEPERTPAADIELELHCAAEGFSAAPRFLRSDAQGQARWSDLPAGSCTVRSQLGGWLELELTAGEETRARFALEVGPTIAGRVIDDAGLPVADAEIWLGAEGHPMIGGVVARSLSNGSFTLRTASDSLCVGARKAGYRVSSVVDIDARAHAAAEVELVLTRGAAALVGRVRAKGEPLAGAAIVVGSARHTTIDRDAAGRFRFEASALETRSAADGSFAIEGLAPGTHEVRVRAAGQAAWLATRELALDERATLEIELAPEAVLQGRVVSSAGEPLAGAWIRSGHERHRILHRARLFVAQSDAQGFFRIGELPAGEGEFEAELHGFAPQRARFHLHAGATTEWNLRLGAGPALRGRVVDEHDAPLVGWQVHLFRAARGEAVISQSIDTDESGRFAFAGLGDVEHQLQIFDPAARPLHPSLVRPQLRPSEAELRFVIAPEARASARVIGRLVDASGAPAVGAEIFVETTEEQPIGRQLANAEGRFELGPLRPGSYRAVAAGPSLPELRFPSLELELRETLDLGELRFAAPAELEVAIEIDDERERANVRFELWQGDRWIDDLGLDQRFARHRGLSAGSYELRLGAPGLYAEPLAVELRAGETTRVTRRVERGAMVTLHFRTAIECFFKPRARFQVRSSTGQEIYGLDLKHLASDGLTIRTTLRAGSYRAELDHEGTLLGEASLEVLPTLDPLEADLSIN